MSPYRLLLVIAGVVLSNAAVASEPLLGTWQYIDSEVSITLQLKDEGRCRMDAASVRARFGTQTLCLYTVRGREVVVAWYGYPVGSSPLPYPLRLLYDAAEDAFLIEGARDRMLARNGRMMANYPLERTCERTGRPVLELDGALARAEMAVCQAAQRTR